MHAAQKMQEKKEEKKMFYDLGDLPQDNSRNCLQMFTGVIRSDEDTSY